MRVNIKAAIVLLLVGMLSGCASLMQDQLAGLMYEEMKKAPIPNYFYIHKNAKVGDKARYTYNAGHGDGFSATELIGYSNGLYEVRIENEDKSVMQFQNRLFVTAKGRVKKAYLDIPEGSFELKVVAPSKTGFLRSWKIEKLPKAQNITVKDKSYRVTHKTTKQTVAEFNLMGSSTSNITEIDFIDPNIPFGVAKRLMISTSQRTPSALERVADVLSLADLSSYVDPDVLEKWLDGSDVEHFDSRMEFSYVPAK